MEITFCKQGKEKIKKQELEEIINRIKWKTQSYDKGGFSQ